MKRSVIIKWGLAHIFYIWHCCPPMSDYLPACQLSVTSAASSHRAVQDSCVILPQNSCHNRHLWTFVDHLGIQQQCVTTSPALSWMTKIQKKNLDAEGKENLVPPKRVIPQLLNFSICKPSASPDCSYNILV